MDVVQPKKEDFNFLRKYWNLILRFLKSEKCIKISEGSAQSKICRMGLSKIWNLIDSWGAKKFFWNLLACAANFSWNLKCAMGRPKSEKCIKISEGSAQSKICRMDLSEIWNLIDFQGAMGIFLKSASLRSIFFMESEMCNGPPKIWKMHQDFGRQRSNQNLSYGPFRNLKFDGLSRSHEHLSEIC